MKKYAFSVPLLIALLFVILEVVTAGNYGFFGDELYYIACSKNLAFGYVDHPPLIALITLISRIIFGGSLWGLRLTAGLAGAGTVLVTVEIVKQLGGGKFAQNLAALTILSASIFPALSSFLSMNSFDILICSICILMLLKIINGADKKYWIYLGITAGIGLLNKYSILNLGFGIFMGLLLTRHRRFLKTKWPYITAIIAFLIFLPHIIWQIENGWPTLEFMRNVQDYKNNPISAFEFLIQLVIGLNPLTLPVWISGFYFFFFDKNAKEFRLAGLIVLIFIGAYMLGNSKFYYAAPVFPLLIAGGAVLIHNLIEKLRMFWIKPASVIIIALSGIVFMPMAVPVLPPDMFLNYSKTLGLVNELQMERGQSDLFPLHFVYRFGWPELVKHTADVYNALPEGERSKCAVFAKWYGPAGAVDLFGKKYGLPGAISGRNNYWLWGPRGYTGEIVIAIGYSRRELEEFFNEVKIGAVFEHPYAYNQTIWICRKPKMTMSEIWKKVKIFI